MNRFWVDVGEQTKMHLYEHKWARINRINRHECTQSSFVDDVHDVAVSTLRTVWDSSFRENKLSIEKNDELNIHVLHTSSWVLLIFGTR